MQFVVSGVLLKDGSTTEIRPTHGIYVRVGRDS